MARTPTYSLALGYTAPEFELLDIVSHQTFTFNQLKGENGTVAMFICNHCPFVVHVLDELIRLGNDYRSKGIGFVVINSNDVIGYPDDAPDKMKDLAWQKKFPFPYLYDESQEVAKAYFAACTPDFSVFDKNNRCVYRGQLDDSRPGNDTPTDGKDLREALEMLIEGKTPSTHQQPSLGCNIKWKPGNEPDYY